MENNANQNIASNYCKRNCGFFGNQAFDGYCSKCYKEHVKRQNSGSAAGRVTPTSLNVNNESASTTNATPIVNTTQQSQPIINVPTTTPMETSSSVSFNIITPDEKPNDNNNNNNNTSNENINNAISNVQTSNTLPENASSSSLLSSTSSSGDGEKKAKRTRCNVDSCRRKLGLTGFDCRCGGVYCWEHRYSDKHCCEFDYKELGQEQIRKNNPVVVGEKIQKI